MDKSINDLKRMDLLIRHEQVMAELYGLFADRSDSYQSFWREMVEDEWRHSKWLTILKNIVAEGKAALVPDRFPQAAIESAIRYMEGQIEDYRREGLSSKKNFEVALRIEREMIESSFFKVFQSDNVQLNELISRIVDETKNHLQKVLDMLK